ncbi:MAG: ribbon-helix-helix domain-containing protein [Alphaproteobacteria bacterium]|nr:ribbon-helix-helix domain-containing protein [Alphaproteobacteria bacterium]MBL0718051.1 ribbon-helix-helix domain-containing protein [Alphaproteobacteria bacterium]
MNKYSITINEHQTSFSLEKQFYDELKKISIKQKISIAKIVASIDKSRAENNKNKENLSSCIRIFILEQLKL